LIHGVTIIFMFAENIMLIEEFTHYFGLDLKEGDCEVIIWEVKNKNESL
jgi:hypothetical protein